MKLLSLNLHLMKEEKQQEKLDRIAKFILDNDIDICIFQEVAQHKDSPKVDELIRVDNTSYYIKKITGYNLFFHPFKLGYQVYEEGLAILSKDKIKETTHTTLSKTKDFNNWLKRDIISCVINDVKVYNTHLGWDLENERFSEQSNKMLQLLKNDNGIVFLAGDFNYPDNSKEIINIKKELYSLADIFKINSDLNPTFHFNLDSKLEFNGNKMIDFIFCNKLISVKDFKIVFSNLEDYVSDHSGIYCEVFDETL